MMNSVWDLALGSTPVNNPGAAASRSVHVELTSQQRRLRHLRSIAARNIVNRNHSPLLDTYFTLHLCSDDRISRDFYKSEVIRDSLNPTWRSLDFAMLPDLLDTSVSCFVVRIWGGREEQYQLLIEWKVNLDGLRYTGQQIRSRCPNEIIFGLNDGYYAADLDQKENSERKKNSLLQVDQSSVRNSYSVFSLLRLHTAQKAIKQTQVTVQKIGKEIEEKLRTTAACTERKKERECMQLRIGVLRSEVERQRKALLRERETLQKERVLLQKKEEAFSCKHKSLDSERDTLTDLQKESTAKRELFLKSSAQLTFRCRQLLSELSYIYPIDTNNQSDFVICGVKLPNSEDFQAKDDGSVAVALGYTAHLVLMISCFLQIPLRYPIMHRGSRSSVRDTITDKLSEKEREFPLYPRGERFHFEYGVYLLNKNIAQLRYQHGLSTPDLRQTLPNLKHFLEHGLLVRCDRHHVSSSIPVPVRSHLSVSQVTFPVSPEADKKKRRSQKLYDPVVTPLPVAMATQEAPPDPLDVSVELEKPLEADRRAEDAGTSTPEPSTEQYDPDEEKIPERDPELPGEPSESECVEENLQHPGAMNGSAGVPAGAEVCCSVEQAEEIMGTEAMGLGLGSRADEFPCIPVEHAVAVECDDQVLGELENFQEFSKRIYALSENPSCFRRPRKNSDK
ncbi:LOW QUALITY PROTEIN: UV radiation resistance-associated gene protein [Pangasianodon hypophthalmus]|uniref:LOW QUALITY PROTEIN: UV radiation resistance-associated gene protein n=1 Tax=Pangasianodon hypophthalmus TaxID=310915 RepID=UPI0023076596|nr:LOW QUALITY PROTEIN: UV radiation resistance-associated gene protein [Pangasianodon hypophthalmus]